MKITEEMVEAARAAYHQALNDEASDKPGIGKDPLLAALEAAHLAAGEAGAVAPMADQALWLPIVSRPTDWSEGWLRLANGSIFWGRWNRDHWERKVDTLTMMTPAPESLGGVHREGVGYPFHIFERLPDGVYPAEWRRSASPTPAATVPPAGAMDAGTIEACIAQLEALRPNSFDTFADDDNEAILVFAIGKLRALGGHANG